MKEGLVMRSTGSWYSLLMPDGSVMDSRLRGSLRERGSKITNFVAVGDVVILDPEGMITDVKPRKNYIIRKATNLSRQWHVLAANLDQAMLVATLAQPRTSTGFIDRFLVTCEAYSIPPVIVFNKADLYTGKLDEDLFVYSELYKEAGYQVLVTSTISGAGLEEVKRLLTGKTTLIAGHSGVGKSTLINAVHPGLELRTGAISDYHKKGTHTTTFAEMFKVDEHSFIIDTPGIKEFGLVEFEKYELSRYFPEMRAILDQCKFNTCLHEHEPGCAVLAAVEAGEIPGFRYKNYLSMLHSEELKKAWE